MALFHDGKWEVGFYEVVDYKFDVNSITAGGIQVGPRYVSDLQPAVLRCFHLAFLFQRLSMYPAS